MKVLDIFDALPLAVSWMGNWTHPFYPLGLLAFGVTLLAGFCFKRFSNQRALAQIRREIDTGYLELILNRGFFGELIRTQGRLLVLNLRYLKNALPAIFVIIVPVIIVLNSFNSFFAYSPLKVGEIFSIKIKGEGAAGISAVEKGVPDGLRFIENDALLGRVVFRALREGEYRVPLITGDATFEKIVVVGNGIKKLAAVKRNRGFMDMLYTFNPSDPEKLPSGVDAVTVDYPDVESPVSFFGWRPGWLSFFIIVSLVPIVFLRKFFDIN
ncbi:MAG: hypothetical protein V3S46_06970 [Nitrospinota bacterium]